MFDIAIHAKSIQLRRFWPTNGNHFRIVFTPRVCSNSLPQKLDFWLEDAAHAWDVYDALRDSGTELLITDDQLESDLRQRALDARRAKKDAAEDEVLF